MSDEQRMVIATWIKSFKRGETRKLLKGLTFSGLQRKGLHSWGYYFKWNREKDEVTRVCPTCGK